MNARHAAREAAVQALYLSEIGRISPEVAVETFFAQHLPDAEPPVREFATRLVLGVHGEQAALDALIAAHSANWRVERLAVTDRIILRLGAWELRHEAETPPAVVLDEAIELARAFGTDDSPSFVNGVLDGIRRKLGN
jgi:transcription antitermination protein NusB